MQTTTRKRLQFWATPTVSLAIGVGYFAAATAGGHPGLGVFMLSVMVVTAVASVIFARHSETVRGLMDHGDERIANIDLTATAAGGMAVLGGVLVGFLVELARGGDGMPYAWLGAVGGVGYIVAVVVLRMRG
jgi:4-hydroxybenzoate polyprenyltransferase